MNVAASTYDGVEVTRAFSAAEGLNYPLLSDQGAATVNALGIRNEQYAEGHPGYGVPHPGVMYVGADGTIRFKRAIPGYRTRPPFEEMLEAVAAAVD